MPRAQQGSAASRMACHHNLFKNKTTSGSFIQAVAMNQGENP